MLVLVETCRTKYMNFLLQKLTDAINSSSANPLASHFARCTGRVVLHPHPPRRTHTDILLVPGHHATPRPAPQFGYLDNAVHPLRVGVSSVIVGVAVHQVFDKAAARQDERLHGVGPLLRGVRHGQLRRGHVHHLARLAQVRPQHHAQPGGQQRQPAHPAGRTGQDRAGQGMRWPGMRAQNQLVTQVYRML